MPHYRECTACRPTRMAMDDDERNVGTCVGLSALSPEAAAHPLHDGMGRPASRTPCCKGRAAAKRRRGRCPGRAGRRLRWGGSARRRKHQYCPHLSNYLCLMRTSPANDLPCIPISFQGIRVRSGPGHGTPGPGPANHPGYPRLDDPGNSTQLGMASRVTRSHFHAERAFFHS